jgi:hypothetical protein
MDNHCHKDLTLWLKLRHTTAVSPVPGLLLTSAFSLTDPRSESCPHPRPLTQPTSNHPRSDRSSDWSRREKETRVPNQPQPTTRQAAASHLKTPAQSGEKEGRGPVAAAFPPSPQDAFPCPPNPLAAQAATLETPITVVAG